jgi:hypothetical protein
VEHIQVELRSFQQVVSDLRDSVARAFVRDDSVLNQLAGLDLDGNSTKQAKDLELWFGTCFVQILKAAESLIA